jgi:hypothetical protein
MAAQWRRACRSGGDRRRGAPAAGCAGDEQSGTQDSFTDGLLVAAAHPAEKSKAWPCRRYYYQTTAPSSDGAGSSPWGVPGCAGRICCADWNWTRKRNILLAEFQAELGPDERHASPLSDQRAAGNSMGNGTGSEK